MKKRINVTRRDIEKGEPRNGWKCAVARALTRAFGDRAFAGLTSAHVVVHRDDDVLDLYDFQLPKRAREFIVALDRDEPVEPIRFTVTYSVQSFGA